MQKSQWDQIKHFKPSEFDDPTKPGSGEAMRWEIVSKLDMMREKTGLMMIVNSGFRTEAHNNRVGGVDSSAHTGGWAADISVRDSRQRFLLRKAALAVGINRIGTAKTFLHFDCDPTKDPEVEWLYP
jgi:uncharacterized protein YcbK (DUF882 family)